MSRKTDAMVTILGYAYSSMTAVATDVRSTHMYHARAKNVPVTMLNARNGRKSFALIKSDLGSKAAISGTSMIAVITVVNTVTCMTSAPARMASTVKVPDVAHMTAASAISP